MFSIWIVFLCHLVTSYKCSRVCFAGSLCIYVFDAIVGVYSLEGKIIIQYKLDVCDYSRYLCIVV